MKKIVMMAALSLVFVTSGYAQFKRTAFNHVTPPDRKSVV